jgi:hypothetical protein
VPTRLGNSVARCALEMTVRRLSALLFVSCVLFVVAGLGRSDMAHASAYPPTAPCASGCTTSPAPGGGVIVRVPGATTSGQPHKSAPPTRVPRTPSGAAHAPSAPTPTKARDHNDARGGLGGSTPPIWIVIAFAVILVIVGSGGVALVTRRR